MASASLVLGIISMALVFGFFPLAPIGVILAILAVVFGAVSRGRDPARKGMATAGFIMGIIGVSFGILFTMIFLTALAIIGGVANAGGVFENYSNLSAQFIEWLRSILEGLQGLENSILKSLPTA